ncbi:MAG: translation initiation factor IF-2 [Thermodesulfovibrionales bacterium]|nr:translation initiation factor IF-2 [Thermodesulfovibrionales bacterium]
MSTIRIYELAKDLGVTTKALLSEISRLGVRGKTHSSGIDEELARKISEKFKTGAAPKKDKKALPPKALPPIGKPGGDAAAPKKADQPVGKAAAPAAKQKTEPEERQKKEAVPQEKPPVEKPPRPEAGLLRPAAKKQMPRHTPGKPETEEPLKEEGPPVVLPEEIVEEKLPEKFKKDIEADKVEKFKARPAMQRAFQAIRKVEQKRWHDQRMFKKHKGERHADKDDKRLSLITAPRKKTLKIHEGMTVKEFAELVSAKLADVIKKFMAMGYMPTVNQPVDIDAALLVAESYGIKLEVASAEQETEVGETPEDISGLKPRPPVVTIMGHVDHGKTSLLDAIRQTKVTETEAGGITQHIGAYKVSLKGKDIVFLDTPGHEAFTALRARGAKVTDTVVLVVAADDGVKPQTIEAVNHAKAAGVPIIVAINKIDKPEANPGKVRTELSELGIIPEDWGGGNIFAEVSAKKHIGIENILEMILLQAEMLELKANPHKPAKGVVIEAKLDKGRGPIATVLVQAGTLKVGDAFLSGVNAGRVRALVDDTGKRIQEAGPSTPVEVIGFGNIPTAGDPFAVMEDERKARQIALARLQKQKAAEMHVAKKLTLDELYSKIKEGQIKELNIIIKADAQGSIEALKSSLEGIAHPEVKVKVIHFSIGGINESDVMLAAASNAIVIGFNVRPEPKAYQIAEKEGVDIRLYNIIYEAIGEVKSALEGMLEPTLKEKVLGRAEVRQTFQVSRIGTIAGCYVIEGHISRASDGLRVIRDNIVVYEGKLSSLKRFKDDAKEVQTGYECGITIENFNDIKVGDIFENYVIEKIAAKL